MDVAFNTAHQSDINTNHLSGIFGIDDAVDWRATIVPDDFNIWETDSALLDSPVSDSDFDIFFQFDEEEDSTYRVVERNNFSFFDPGEHRKKASPPPEDGRAVNPKDVDSCEAYDDEASGVSSDGALTSSDGCASPQLSNVPDHATTLCGSQDSEQSLKSPEEAPTVKDLDDHTPCTDSARTRKCSVSTSSSGDAPRAKRRRRHEDDPVADEEFFPSRREKKARLLGADRRSLEVIDHENCLRVKCVSLMIDEESLCYEWNRHSEQWECKNDSEMAPTSSDIMNDFFAQPGADLLHVWVRVDDQLLEFEFSPENRRWEAEDINGAEVHLDAGFMRKMVSMPMMSSWAGMF